jgi:cAMP response element-binding protein
MAANSTSAQSILPNPSIQVSGSQLLSKQVLILSGGGLPLPSSIPSSSSSLALLNPHKPEDALKRRELLARQPSYCKILNDLKETESSGSEDSLDHKSIVMKGESVELVDSNPASQGQTVVINGQQYQIVSPAAMDSVISLSGGNQFTNSNGGTVFLPSASSPDLVEPGSSPGSQAEEQARKREIRLMKNREAARECRNKKKEYIKCLENRVAVLENQNKALIEELKSLKELYKSQN